MILFARAGAWCREKDALRRPLNEDAVVKLTESIKRIGLQTPITVRRVDDWVDADGEVGRALVLVTGAHRLESAKRLSWGKIPVIVREWSETEARLWEISENLHRADLTALERDEQIAEWIALTTKEQVVSGKLPETRQGRPGIPASVKTELGIEETDAKRAKKVAAIAPEAKAAIVAFNLDDNRTAMLAVAKEATPAAQVAKVQEIAAKKAEPRAKPAPLPPYRFLAGALPLPFPRRSNPKPTLFAIADRREA